MASQAVWMQAQVQLQDCQLRSAELELVCDAEKIRLADLLKQADLLKGEKEALGVELKKATEKAAQLEKACNELSLQAGKALEEGNDLADQLRRYLERKQESEEQLAKDSCGFDAQIVELTRRLAQFKAHLAEV